MSLPKISIVIPTYNYGRFLEKAIKSVIDQNYPNLELIVLDGGSSDNTLDVIEKYSAHITKWRSHKDISSNSAVNEGFDMATGDLVGLLCADDWYEPGIFHSVAEVFEADRELDVITFHFRYMTADGTITKEVHEDLLLDTLGVASPNGSFFRKNFFYDYGHLRINFSNNESVMAADYELMYRLSFLPIRQKVLNRMGYTYLVHEDSFSYGKDVYLTTEKINEEYVDLFSKFLEKEQQNLYSKYMLKRFKRMHLASCAKLYLIKKELGNDKGAELYKSKGLQHHPRKWNKALRRLERKDEFQNLVKSLKDANRSVRVQTEK